MKLIEVTETQDILGESANDQEPIVLTRNGQAIAVLTPLESEELVITFNRIARQISC